MTERTGWRTEEVSVPALRVCVWMERGISDRDTGQSMREWECWARENKRDAAASLQPPARPTSYSPGPKTPLMQVSRGGASGIRRRDGFECSQGRRKWSGSSGTGDSGVAVRDERPFIPPTPPPSFVALAAVHRRHLAFISCAKIKLHMIPDVGRLLRLSQVGDPCAPSIIDTSTSVCLAVRRSSATVQ